MDVKMLIGLAEKVLSPSDKAKLKAIMTFKDLLDELIPAEKQTELFETIKNALPPYKIVKKPSINGKQYALAILIEQPTSKPEDEKQ